MNKNNAKKRLAVLVSGGGTNMQAIMDKIDAGEIPAEIAVVISSNPNAYALERAKKRNIPAYVCALKDYKDGKCGVQAPNIGAQSKDGGAERDKAILKLLKKYSIDYVLLAGYLGILTDCILKSYPNRILNIHPALLPSFGGPGFYGLKVHEAALKRGVKVTGATVHFVSGEVDGGPIVMQKAVNILSNDTPETLQKRVMAEAEHIIFPEAVKLLCEGKIEAKGGKAVIK